MLQVREIHLAETDSTNRFLHEYKEPWGKANMIAVRTDFQTAGRGQGTNHWESERGQNLLMSIKVRPRQLPANRQYAMLQAAALAVAYALNRHAEGFTIKWPNDIYYGDRKISGTLTECTIRRGMVAECVIGIGVNINQTTFTNYAPNPVSLRQITGRHTDIADVMHDIIGYIGSYLVTQINEGRYQNIADSYMRTLYRREGRYPYRDADGTFVATIDCVEPDGHLVLRRTDGTKSRYSFKEVTFVIPQYTQPDGTSHNETHSGATQPGGTQACGRQTDTRKP